MTRKYTNAPCINVQNETFSRDQETYERKEKIYCKIRTKYPCHLRKYNSQNKQTKTKKIPKDDKGRQGTFYNKEGSGKKVNKTNDIEGNVDRKVRTTRN